MRLRRSLLLLYALFALGPPVLFAQAQRNGTITSTQCVPIDVSAQSTVGIQVTGTWTGTLQPKISIQGQTAANIQVTPSTSSTAQSTITANGIYTAKVAGGSTFLLCGASVASGTANIFLNASQGVAVIVPDISPSGTVGGLAGATAGATPPSPVGTSSCAGNPFVWVQDAGGTYQTQASSDSSLAVTGFSTNGFLDLCRPPIFNSTGATPGLTYNGTSFNVYGQFSALPDRHMSTQWRYQNDPSDSATYTTGNLNQTYSEFFLKGTPTINTTFVANQRVTMDDFKTGGSKPRVWSAYQAAARKQSVFDATNCQGGINGFANGPCYVGYYGETQYSVATTEDQTGVVFDVFAGGTSTNGLHSTAGTGNVFHALVQSSTNNRFPNSNGFLSEDFGSAAGYRNILSKGTSTTGINEFQGPTIFGTGGIQSFNSITTAGLGIPVQAARVRSVSQTSAIGTTTLLATGSATTDYLVVGTLYCDSTSAGATVSVTISYTDPGSQAQTIAPSAATCTALGSSSFALINSPIVAKNGTNITYSTSIANTPTYDLRLDLYQLGTN